MPVSRPFLPLSVLVASLILPAQSAQSNSSPAVSQETLRAEFAEPPMERRLRAWWFWILPYLNADGMQKDIRAMEEAGMGGVNVMTIQYRESPVGWGTAPTVAYNSDAYYDIARRVLESMAGRGMKFDTHNVEFYKGASGRWVTLEQGMRMLRVEHLHVEGPQDTAIPWPEFPTGAAQWESPAKWKAHIRAPMGPNSPTLPPGERASFRDVALFAVPGHIEPLNQLDINIGLLTDERQFDRDSKNAVGRAGTVAMEDIVRLDDKLLPDGTIDWKIPPGKWTVLRFFSEPTGFKSAGLEVDKWDRDLLLDTIDKQVGTLVEQNKQHIDGTFQYIVQDSWESSIQTWSANMPEVFKKRRGYDPLPWLPVLAGVAVNDLEQSQRFLWDLRRTIADQFIYEGWISILKEWANQRGLGLALERPLGFINDTEWWSIPEKPMDESWFREPWDQALVKQKRMVAATADFHGKPIVGMEAFTNVNHPYLEHPNVLKPIGDSYLCSGWNQLIPHCYVHQPFDNKPGPRIYGIINNRSNTWWPYARPFFLHIGRAQTLLQQLDGVADVLFVEDETIANDWRAKRAFTDALPPGLLFDACDASQLEKLTVDDGKIVGPGGKRYSALAFGAKIMDHSGDLGHVGRVRPEVLEQLLRLAKAGARIHATGGKPTGAPGLTDYPASDRRVAELATALWDGGLVRGIETLGEGLDPDLANHGDLNWTHRAKPGFSAYFLAHHGTEPTHREVSFRSSGRAPQLWHPETGEVHPLPVWREENGRTIVPLGFEPFESYFVVFADSTEDTGPRHWTEMKGSPDGRLLVENGKPLLLAGAGGSWTLTDAGGKTTELAASAPPSPIEIAGPWTLSYPPGQGTPETLTLPRLQNMIEHDNQMVRGFSGTVTYRTTFEVPVGTLAKDLRFSLDLGNVQQVAAARLNGEDIGIAWRIPYRLNATSALKEGSNTLEVDVTNTWHNRMVIQIDLPEAERIGDPTNWQTKERLNSESFKHLKNQDYLMDSGLIGPVRIVAQRIVPVP